MSPRPSWAKCHGLRSESMDESRARGGLQPQDREERMLRFWTAEITAQKLEKWLSKSRWSHCLTLLRSWRFQIVIAAAGCWFDLECRQWTSGTLDLFKKTGKEMLNERLCKVTEARGTRLALFILPPLLWGSTPLIRLDFLSVLKQILDFILPSLMNNFKLPLVLVQWLCRL